MSLKAFSQKCPCIKAAVLNYGQGDYLWNYQNITNGKRVIYSNPSYSNFITSEWNDSYLPIKVEDIDSRILEFGYDNNEDITAISSLTGLISFNYGINKTTFSTNSGESILFSQEDFNSLNVTSTGTVSTITNFNIQELPDKKKELKVVSYIV